jgi:hypothetical protein
MSIDLAGIEIDADPTHVGLLFSGTVLVALVAAYAFYIYVSPYGVVEGTLGLVGLLALLLVSAFLQGQGDRI